MAALHTCTFVCTLTGVLAVFVPLREEQSRPLTEDHALLAPLAREIRHSTKDNWQRPPTKVIWNGKERTIVPFLIFARDTPNYRVHFKGEEEFWKKSKIGGALFMGFIENNNPTSTSRVYRLNQQGIRRFLAVPDMEGGEFTFSYELDRATLRLRGGKAITLRDGLIDFAGDYRYVK